MPKPLVCVCMCKCEHANILKRKRCLSIYFHVPSAHLALVTAPVTCVWFCSIPAPITPLWESRVMTECCCSSQDPWQYGCSLLCLRLEMASCWPVCYFFPSSSSEWWCFFKENQWSQWQPHPDIHVILRIYLQKHWFMHYFCSLKKLASSIVTARHNTGRCFSQDSNCWFDLIWCPFDW